MEIELRDEELGENLDLLEKKIQDLQNHKNEFTKNKLIEQTQDLINTADRNLKHIKLESRTIPSSDRPKWKIKLKAREEAFDNLKENFLWVKRTDSRQEKKEDDRDVAAMTSEQFTDYGENLQKETIAVTDNIIRDLADTTETATKTAAMLNAQTQQIQNMYDELYEVDEMLDRAKKIMSRMLRRTATDKYMWILVFLVVAAVITIIVLKATGNADGLETSVDDQVEGLGDV